MLAALRREHLEVPGGLVESRRIEYTVKSDAEFRTLKELERLVVSYQDGTPVYLKDVARVEDGAEDVRTMARYNGQTAVGLGILKQSGGNTVAIVDEVYKRLREVREILPEGIEIDDTVSFIDFSRSIREAVAETKFTLVFGALLAVFTVFVFLRRTRPTLIIAAAIPISLVATFGLVWLSGYSLNTMTLLGMTLVVGVVIDDAIIVLENIERHRELGEAPRVAAAEGTRQIVFAATAATVSVAAVFLPVVFVEGIVGNFMGEFGLTVAGSVMISLFVALTLTPMLAARMPPPKARPPGGVYHRLEIGFRRHRDELQENALLDARPPRRHHRRRRRGLRPGALLRLEAEERVLSPGRRGDHLRPHRIRARKLDRCHARVPRVRRGVVPPPARARGALLRRRHHRAARPGAAQRGHDVRDAPPPRPARARAFTS